MDIKKLKNSNLIINKELITGGSITDIGPYVYTDFIVYQS
jgi:hypothetical protein